jgi:alanine racemase
MHQHHVTVSVSRETFASNIRYLRTQLAPSKFCVVMKANAYGHGLPGLAQTAIQAGADYLGICANPEAWKIRGIDKSIPILRLRMALPEELDESVGSLNMEELVGSTEVAEYLDQAGRKRGQAVPVHIKIDTGMGRTGFFPEQLDEIRRACDMPGLKIRGIMTHLAKADAKDLGDAENQLEAFGRLRQTLENDLPDDVLNHTHNSAASVRMPEKRADLVRVGAACYGVRTSQHFSNPAALRPVMSVKTRIAQIRRIPAGKTIGYGGLFTTTRDSLIASLPIGFGEGYPRALYNKGIVLIRGQRCPIVGRVSLNVITVDITDLEEKADWGEEVVVIGAQGKETVTFEEMADLFDSVHTEINLMAGSMNEITYT